MNKIKKKRSWENLKGSKKCINKLSSFIFDCCKAHKERRHVNKRGGAKKKPNREINR
jgi:hypothetical protein